ncbi:MAG: GIY-YIG nuclease family protein [Hyphomonadaceae bacterium]
MDADRLCAVYMLASGMHGTLYVGVTSDLLRRVSEHREGVAASFTKRYAVSKLVWFEPYDFLDAARVREKRIKAWRRDWKCALVERSNPQWNDLFPSLAGGKGVSPDKWKPPTA